MVGKSSGTGVISRAGFFGRVCVLGVSFVFAGAAQANDAFYWKAAEGKWSEVSNWYSDADCTVPATRYPGSDVAITTDEAYFVAAMPGGTVHVDKDVTIFKVYVYKSNASGATAATAPITFDGGEGRHKVATTSTANGASSRNQFYRSTLLTNIGFTGTFLTVMGGKGMNLVIGAGADVSASNRIYIWQNYAALTFEDGCKYVGAIEVRNLDNVITVNGGKVGGGKSFTLNGDGDGKNPVLNIFGGEVSAYEINCDASAKISITGGSLKLSKVLALDDVDKQFSFTGGTLVWPSDVKLTDRRFLGKKDAVFVTNYKPTSYDYKMVDVLTAENPTLELDSQSLVATNGQYAGFGSDLDAPVSVTASGSMVLSRFYQGKANVVHTYDIGKIILRNGFRFIGASRLDFPNGLRLGSIGDWGTVWAAGSNQIWVWKELSIDTSDALDPAAAPHAVTLKSVRANNGVSWSVTGGGSAAVSADTLGWMTDLSIGDGTTLEISKAVDAQNLSLGKGSTLRITNAGTSVRADGGTVDPTAKIEVPVASGLTDQIYPVFSVEDADASRDFSGQITLTGDGADEYTLRTVAGVSFFTTGHEPTVDPQTTSNIWIGAVDGNWATAGNWANGTVPVSSSKSPQNVFFTGSRNTVVTNDHDLADYYYLNRLVFLEDCGPYVLRGNRLRLQASGTRNTSTAPVLSKSPFPVVIENDIYKPSSLYPCNCSDSYIAFNGDIQISETFGPVGDIRIGGAITAKNFYLASGYYSGGRVTRATVRSGASITASKQTLFQDKMASHMVIDAGGSVVFQDGDAAYLGYTAAQSNNVVNGTLTVGCPLGTCTSPQFAGTGRIEIAGVHSATNEVWTGVSGEFGFAGSLTVKFGEWLTTDSVQPSAAVRFHVRGDIVLEAEAGCFYGPEPGIAPASEAADREMLIDEGASLTVGGTALALADRIVGPGTLVFETGVGLVPSGALCASAGWTEIARVGAIEGLPVCETFRFKTVENDDGTVSLLSKPRGGLLLLLR